MAPKTMEPHESEEDSELERLESDLKQMAHRILDYRTKLPDQLNATLRSILDAQRPFLSPGTSEQNISREESSSAPEDPETAKKLKLLNEKISSNCSAMPIVLKRMKDCIARIEKFDSYNDSMIHPAFKRKKTG
ncbi:hypothetical protein JHK82_051378 [Glycine max]|uniref:Uncharacterized protein n=2 Tax=Glycine subgen. Soja TaxID=1462606 RepID=I1N3M9_SOYBN|nr:uncharacterized protein LOC100798294 [Glycine max]XP_028213078.1 uncharacterized protein LOC114395483 [Glycine soja]KAG4922408.1 hypothetical protein JHK86_051221 [Glycine max]KAG5092600.1 hypothetical protein JHK82_051378 [Glycine max]KAG5095659.1 hypothetical protein JHK84_051247 [Glycine max]KAH1155752.1 hypothetical protein GYH30_050846 [Glycine max]KAH1199720.1 hypothetical protein GmHk_18G053009 [Glycine max]|eukprot:XP_003552378.1 uncharacterized protein LOC100798294 [Glycine max]